MKQYFKQVQRHTRVMETGDHFKNGSVRLFFLAALCLTAGIAPAQETININHGGSTLRAAQTVAAPEGSLRSRSFESNPRLSQLTEANRGDTLVLDFFEDSRYKAVISGVTVSYDGVLGIAARIVDTDFAACFISISKAGISLRADLPEGDAHFRAAGVNGKFTLSQHALSEMRKKELPSGSDVVLPPPASTESSVPPSVQLRADDLEAHVTIDVLVVYTAYARQQAEQDAISIDNAISLAFQYANYVLDNSQVNITLNMVYKYETGYNEVPGDGNNLLNALQSQGDGKMDEVHALRRQYKADLVVLMSAGSGGIAYYPSSDLTRPDPTDGFCRVGVYGAAYGNAMIHEIGHNMGAGHHWQQVGEVPDIGIFTYSSAWFGRGVNDRWYYTVMSYDGYYFSPQRNPSTMIPYFANPNITVNSVRIGSEKENNSLTLKQTKHVIARYSALLIEVSGGVLTRYTGAGGYVAIPSELGVKTIGASAFRGVEGLTSIVIPEGVTSIEDRAFENCTGLTAVTLPSSLTHIGTSAFGGCTKLNQVFTDMQTPPAVAANMFTGVRLSSANLIVPAGRKSVYAAAAVWNGFGVITEIHVVSDFVIENGVLKKYAGLKLNVVIPAEVTAIGESAFINSRIVSVAIGERVTSIGSDAFALCKELQSISIPKTVTHIGDEAFRSAGLKEINVDAGNPTYASIDGVLFNKDKTTLWIYPPEKEAASYAIPQGVRTVPSGSFPYDNYNLKTVSVPASVNLIVVDAFLFYTLESIEVDEANATYASQDGVLFNKDKTTLWVYPAGKKETSYAIPKGVRTVPFGSFPYDYDNYHLKTVSVPASVNLIETAAFPFYTLESIEVDEANATYASQDGVLYNKAKSSLIIYPSGKLGKVIIPGTVTEIGENSFWNCERLDSIVIPASVRTIKHGFGNFRRLRYMEVHWKTPLEDVPFNQDMDDYFANATLSVPEGTASRYRASTMWGKFRKIVERTATGTEDVATGGLSVYSEGNTLVIDNPVAEDVRIYSISGKLLYQTAKTAGVLRLNTNAFREKVIILQGSSGWARKTVIRK